MSMTYAVLAAKVAGFLEIGASDYDRFQILDSLNKGQKHILNTWDSRFLVDAIKTGIGDLSDNQPLYQFPSDYLRVVALWLSYNSPITPGDPNDFGRLATEFKESQIVQNNRHRYGTKKYPTYTLGAEQGFEIRPVPTSYQQNGYRMRYVYLLPEISATQPCLFRDDKENCLVWFATGLSASVENYRPDIATAMMKLYEGESAQFLPKKEEK
jgi:hypothetical protein